MISWHSRIGTIKFLFEDDDEKLAHIQWFEHGSQTVLGETASSQELFLLNKCDLIPLSTTASHCNLADH